MLAANVTPAALTTCRSLGAIKWRCNGLAPCLKVSANQAVSVPRGSPLARCTARRGFGSASSADMVAAVELMSTNASFRTTTRRGPASGPGHHALPTKHARLASSGSTSPKLAASMFDAFTLRRVLRRPCSGRSAWLHPFAARWAKATASDSVVWLQLADPSDG